jgi:hypothetical protein
MDKLQALGRLAQKAGPYLLLEMLLPGGTLIALLVYLHQRGDLRSWDAVRRLAGEVGARIERDLERASLTRTYVDAWPVTMNH